MSTLTLEPGEERSAQCDCCGNATRTVSGYIYADDDAHAVYFARWTVGHRDRGLEIAVSLGEWGEGSSPARRWAAVCDGRFSNGQLGFSLIDPEGSPWSSREFLGRFLSRDEARSHPQIKQYWSIVDLVIVADERVARALTSSVEPRH